MLQAGRRALGGQGRGWDVDVSDVMTDGIYNVPELHPDGALCDGDPEGSSTDLVMREGVDGLGGVHEPDLDGVEDVDVDLLDL